MAPNTTDNADKPTPHLPVPLPEPPPPPQLGWLIGHRLLIIVLVVAVFIIMLFLFSGERRVTQVTPPEEMATAAPKEAAPVAAPATHGAPPPAAHKPEGPLSPEARPVPEPHPGAEPKLGAEPKPFPEPAGKEHPPAHAPAPAPGDKKPLVLEKPEAARPPEKAVRGEAFTLALIKIIDDQVNKPLLGWRPNTILLGYLRLTDNVNNLQLGVLEVARRTTWVLAENMSRFATTEAHNPHLNEAMNFLMVSPDKYWFPSASGKYREAMADLRRYIDDLKNNRSRFYPRVDNLIVLMTHFKDILGSCFHNLIKDTEADGKPVPSSACDDYFYFAQGVAVGMSEILEAVLEDFGSELHKKNSHKLMEDAIHALHTAGHLNPWFITNADKDGILANHRANMGTYIGEAEHVISTLQTVLATN
jgi:hypothetical protein